MTYKAWIEHVEHVMAQYNEGAITAREAFNNAVTNAQAVLDDPCYAQMEELRATPGDFDGIANDLIWFRYDQGEITAKEAYKSLMSPF